MSKNSDEKSHMDYMTWGIIMGPTLGLVIFGSEGLALGLALGAAIGALLDAWKKGIQPSRE